MKLKIMNNGYGWFVPIRNFKDKNEKPIFMNIYFAKNKCIEPMFDPDNSGKDKKIIDIKEASFNKYEDNKGLHLSMTIFDYEQLSSIEPTENNMMMDNGERYQTRLNDGNRDMFGGSSNIDSDNLPFY